MAGPGQDIHGYLTFKLGNKKLLKFLLNCLTRKS